MKIRVVTPCLTKNIAASRQHERGLRLIGTKPTLVMMNSLGVCGEVRRKKG